MAKMEISSFCKWPNLARIQLNRHSLRWRYAGERGSNRWCARYPAEISVYWPLHSSTKDSVKFPTIFTVYSIYCEKIQHRAEGKMRCTAKIAYFYSIFHILWEISYLAWTTIRLPANPCSKVSNSRPFFPNPGFSVKISRVWIKGFVDNWILALLVLLLFFLSFLVIGGAKTGNVGAFAGGGVFPRRGYSWSKTRWTKRGRYRRGWKTNRWHVSSPSWQPAPSATICCNSCDRKKMRFFSSGS